MIKISDVLADRINRIFKLTPDNESRKKAMTTVAITARVPAHKEVHITINDLSEGSMVEEFTLQDGEYIERFIFDAREISIMELTKL